MVKVSLSLFTLGFLSREGPVTWVMALAVALIVYLLLRLIIGFAGLRMTSISQKTVNVVDDIIAATLSSTKQFALLTVAIWCGLQFVDLGGWERYLHLILVAVLTLQVAIWGNRTVSAYIEHYTLKNQEENPGSISAVQGMSFVVRLIIWSVAVLLIIDNLGYDVTALVAGLGIGGIAIALAVQNILSDLFASLSIILDKPFVVGDFIIVDELVGVVQRIGLKTTRLKSLSGEQLVFSNADLLNSRIRNFKRMYERRVPFSFGLVYQTTPEQLEAIPPILKEIIEKFDDTRFDRAHFKGFGDSSLDFEVVYYVLSPDYGLFMDIQQSINLAMIRRFKDLKIEFAYPTRTLFIDSGKSE